MTVKKQKRALIRNWGCQMNVYDGDRMADILKSLNYQMTDNVDEADFVIFNTCHIREKATEKIYSELGRLKPHNERARAKGGDMIVAIAGCVAQAEGEEIFKNSKIVDMVFGPQSYHRLPQMLEQIGRERGVKILDLDFPVEDKFDSLPFHQKDKRQITAFLTIQEGCDKFCSFCVVPYTRGAEFSRPATKIFREAAHLIAQGVQELTLLGQNVNAWQATGTDGRQWSFARLLYGLVEKFPELKRLRYTTSHPRDMDETLLKAHSESEIPQLMPYLHLPIQSGSDKILRAMNRGHNAKDYLTIIEKLRHYRENIALSSDFIVGFPEESDQDFADTIRLVREVGFGASYSFKYSPRPGTPAALMEKQIPENIKNERLQSLQQLLTSQQKAFNQSFVGKVIPILFEKPGKYEHQIVGRTPWLQPTYANLDSSYMGKQLDCRITALTANSFASEPLIDSDDAKHLLSAS